MTIKHRDHLFSDTVLTQYQHRGVKCMPLMHCLPTDVNVKIRLLKMEHHHLQRKSCLCNLQANCTSIWIQAWKHTHRHTLSCLSSYIKEKEKADCQRKKVADSKICAPAWLDFHLLPTTAGEVNEVVPWSYHYQPECPQTLGLVVYILISYAIIMKSASFYSLERQSLHISTGLKAATSFVHKHKHQRHNWL